MLCPFIYWISYSKDAFLCAQLDGDNPLAEMTPTIVHIGLCITSVFIIHWISYSKYAFLCAQLSSQPSGEDPPSGTFLFSTWL